MPQQPEEQVFASEGISGWSVTPGRVPWYLPARQCSLDCEEKNETLILFFFSSLLFLLSHPPFFHTDNKLTYLKRLKSVVKHILTIFLSISSSYCKQNELLIITNITTILKNILANFSFVFLFIWSVCLLCFCCLFLTTRYIRKSEELSPTQAPHH